MNEKEKEREKEKEEKEKKRVGRQVKARGGRQGCPVLLLGHILLSKTTSLQGADGSIGRRVRRREREKKNERERERFPFRSLHPQLC